MGQAQCEPGNDMPFSSSCSSFLNGSYWAVPGLRATDQAVPLVSQFLNLATSCGAEGAAGGQQCDADDGQSSRAE